MMRLVSLLLPALVIAGQAQALNCTEPSLRTSFQAAMASPDQYVILRGQFAFDPALFPGDATTRGNPNLPPPDAFAADFTGQALEPDGFTRDLAVPVTLQSVCLGPWCGRFEPGTEVMVFAQSRPDGLVLEVHPCGTWVFPGPTAAMEDEIGVCMADPASCMD